MLTQRVLSRCLCDSELEASRSARDAQAARQKELEKQLEAALLANNRVKQLDTGEGGLVKRSLCPGSRVPSRIASRSRLHWLALRLLSPIPSTEDAMARRRSWLLYGSRKKRLDGASRLMSCITHPLRIRVVAPVLLGDAAPAPPAPAHECGVTIQERVMMGLFPRGRGRAPDGPPSESPRWVRRWDPLVLVPCQLQLSQAGRRHPRQASPSENRVLGLTSDIGSEGSLAGSLLHEMRGRASEFLRSIKGCDRLSHRWERVLAMI